jgi:hypothetical protein
VVSSSEINRKLAEKRGKKKDTKNIDLKKDINPSTEDLKDKFRKKHDKKASHRYLVCKSCLGFYELHDGENPDDFSTCSCGGKLSYTENLDSFFNSKN